MKPAIDSLTYQELKSFGVSRNPLGDAGGVAHWVEAKSRQGKPKMDFSTFFPGQFFLVSFVWTSRWDMNRVQNTTGRNSYY
jgi:hypothetical protein